MSNNPFSLIFENKPINYIERKEIIDRIIDDFNSKNPESYLYSISGIKGSGKTVILYDLNSRFDNMDDFLTVNLNLSDNLIEEFALKLYDKAKTKNIYLEKILEIKFSGATFSIDGKEEIKSIDTVLEKTITYLKKKNKKVLITIDEVYNSNSIRHFFHVYQNLIGLDLPVYILMTGLYDNIFDIQNEKSLTFLYRSPKIFLEPLNFFEMVDLYKNVLALEENFSIELAKLSKGYSFGFQLLGNIVYNNKYTTISKELLNEFDNKLSIYSYDKIYETLSKNELELLYSINGNSPVTSKECLTRTSLNEKAFSVYKDKLTKKGILQSVSYGNFMIALPRFYEYLDKKRKLLY